MTMGNQFRSDRKKTPGALPHRALVLTSGLSSRRGWIALAAVARLIADITQYGLLDQRITIRRE
jgi:hypothetical protein